VFEAPAARRTILLGAGEKCLLVDPWNSLGTSQVFLYAAESEALARPQLAPTGAEGRR
jgi:UDP-N-acetyl-D-mannosaminuronic acid dehydrogenase